MNKVPNLRFNNFNDEWQEHVLGDIFEFYTTNSFSRDFLDNDNGSVKNIHYGDIHMKFPTLLDVKNTQIPYVKETVDLSKISIESYCKNGDVVIADASEDYNDIGKAIELQSVGEEKVIAGLHTILARDNKGIMVNGFRGYLMTSPNVRKQIKVYAAGAKVLGISKANISKVNLLIPSSMEQEKIASFFSLIDKKIELQTEKVEELKNYKKGIMQKIFSQQLRFKDEDGNEYPEWARKHLSQFVQRVTRKNKGLVSTLPLTISAQYGLVDQESFFNKTVASNNLEGYYLLENGEFAYNKSYSNGYPWGTVKRLDKYKCGVLSSLYICFNPNIDINSNYLVHYFESTKWHKEIAMIAVEGARNHGLLNISISDFFDTLHYIPSREEQDKIAVCLSAIDKKIYKEQEKLDALVDYKKGLLQQMFV